MRNEVDQFMESLDHPSKDVFSALRETILSVDPAVTEGIKWNAPSFRLADDFATFNLRKPYALVILHLGAQRKDVELAIDDPEGLLEWLGKDRAAVKFQSLEDLASKREALESVLREWIVFARL